MFQVTMPQASNTMEEGTIVRWLKRPGDHIKQGEILLEIETDKATVEVEAPAEGILNQIIAAEGAIVPIHAPIAVIGGEMAAPQQPAVSPAPAPVADAPNVSPVVEAVPALASSATPIPMPQAGNSMETGTIVKWTVKPGDRIKVGQVLGEIETDKAVVDLESPAAGRVARIVAAEGAVVPVHEPILILAETDADADAWLKINAAGTPAQPVAPPRVAVVAPAAAPRPAPAPPQGFTPAASPKPMPMPVPVASPVGGRAKASPAARQLAQVRGIDLSRIPVGSGPGGRILSTDVPSTQAPGRARPGEGPVAIPLAGMRKAIAKNLALSKQTIPHFYMRLTINAGLLMAFYRARKGRYPISLNDLVIAGCAVCQREIPQFRSRLEGDNIVEYPVGNIGIAVGTDDALLVPVVMGPEQLTLHQLAATTRRTVESARSGKVLNGGRGQMTISNLGMFGVDEFSAIINPPECAILAVAGVKEVVHVQDGAMRPGLAMTMTLSADHRVIDGVVAAKFMQRLRELLENPDALNEAMPGPVA